MKTGINLCLVLSLLLCFISQVSVIAKENYDSIIVVPRKGNLNTTRLNKHGIFRLKKIKEQIYVIPLNVNENKELKIKELKRSRLFKLVEPDYKFFLDEASSRKNFTTIDKNLVVPNDKDFSSQYYLKEINATKAWNTTVGNMILVGVLDSGIDTNHPDLVGKILIKEDLNDNNLINNETWHGTAVAGIIAANTNNKQGIAGIAWNSRILSIKVTDDANSARVSTIVAGLELAYKEGVKIVQISLSTNEFSRVLQNAIEEAQSRGILVISSGGNSGLTELRYPAALPGVIGVGAVDKNQDIESYSTTGDHITLVAPGASIYTTSTGSNYATVSGTSFAAPQVAGACALIWSVAPDLTNNQVREILIQSTTDLGKTGKDSIFGYGLLNIEKAVEMAKVITTH